MLKKRRTNHRLGEFNAHIGNDAGVFQSVIGRHADADVNGNSRLLLHLCWNNAVCIMNSFCQPWDVHKLTWCRFFFLSTVTYLFYRSLTWYVPFSVERSCQMCCRNVQRSPLCGLPLPTEKPTENTQQCRTRMCYPITWEALANKDLRRTLLHTSSGPCPETSRKAQCTRRWSDRWGSSCC